MTDAEKLDLILAKMENFATKTDLRNEINLVLGELDSTEDRINRKFDPVDKKLHELNVKIETLRYSNEAIEILMKRQDLMDLRLQKVEKKVSYL